MTIFHPDTPNHARGYHYVIILAYIFLINSQQLVAEDESARGLESLNWETVRELYKKAKESGEKVQKDINDFHLTESNYEYNKQTIVRLEESLLTAITMLNRAIDEKQKRMDVYRQKLEKDGLFYEVKTGMLRRYLALKNIHKDPEIGEAAFMFSLLLKIFFIAIELMPVVIKLFFSPFSFYSLRMYRKMQVALLEEEEKLKMAKAKHRKWREYPIKDTG